MSFLYFLWGVVSVAEALTLIAVFRDMRKGVSMGEVAAVLMFILFIFVSQVGFHDIYLHIS